MTRRRRTSSTADTDEMAAVKKPRKKTKRKTVTEVAVEALGKRSGGVKRLMKVTEGVERMLWAIEQTDEDEVKPFSEIKMSDEEILLAAQFASALIIIRDGLEVGG